MQAQVKLGRIAGICIGLHYSWFIIAFLIALSLADHFHTVTPEWSKAVVWSAAIVTGALFFVALLRHELFVKQVADLHPSLCHLSNMLVLTPRPTPRWVRYGETALERAIPYLRGSPTKLP